VVSRYEYNVEAGVGAGRYRGGFGLVREYVVESDDVLLHASYGRTATPPWGVGGGAPGTVNGIEVLRNGARRRLTRPPHFPLECGDRVIILTGGGGGWGEPHARDPNAVGRDILDDLVTVADAAAFYGVVIDPATSKVDLAATARLRAGKPQEASQ
jgi:N-methylhydantoinase B